MFLGQTIPYLRRKDHFTLADKWGSWVAHQDIVRAALRYGSIEGVHFFLREHLLLQDGTASLQELRQDFPCHQVEIKHAWELTKLARQHKYVFPVEFVSFSTLAHARHTGRGCVFPVSAIVHATPGHQKLDVYFEALLLAEEFDTIVTTSEAGSRAVETMFDGAGEYIASKLGVKSVPRIKLKKIPLGVDETFLQVLNRHTARESLGLPAHAKILLYVGRLTESFKADLEPLLMAFRRLTAVEDDLYLVIAGHEGREGYGSTITAVARELGVGERLILKSNFAFSEKPLLFAAADIFVSPVDNIQETFGIALLEAMAAGLPVVASDWSGYRDLVVHGETGFLVRTYWNGSASAFASAAGRLLDTTEAGRFLAQQTVVEIENLYFHLKTLLKSEELRTRMGARGRQRVMTNFRWPVVIEQYEALWQEQWAILGCHQEKKNGARLPLNFDRVFSHYASQPLDNTTVFRRSPDRALPNVGIGINPMRLPATVTISELQRVLDECGRQPQSVDELARDRDGGTVNTVAWLWKKGYLELDVEKSV